MNGAEDRRAQDTSMDPAHSLDAATRPTYHAYDVATLWDGTPGLTVRRLVHAEGVVPIPRILPGYRMALSLGQNDALLTIGRHVATTGQFNEGTMVLGQPENSFDGEMRGRVDVLLLLMQPSFLADRLACEHRHASRVELVNGPPRRDIGLLDAGRRLKRTLDLRLSGTELYCDMLMDAIVTRIVILHGSSPEGRMPYRETLSPARLRRLLHYVEANLSSALRLDDLAAVAALSRAHLARAFRDATGLSPHRYVLQRRLEKAREMLHRGDRSAGVIAAQCGFADVAHFSRAYKTSFGVAPSATLPCRC